MAGQRGGRPASPDAVPAPRKSGSRASRDLTASPTRDQTSSSPPASPARPRDQAAASRDKHAASRDRATARDRSAARDQATASRDLPAGTRPGGDALTMEIGPVSHRKPNRVFQLVGVFVLVAGAVAGAYVTFGRHSGPSPEQTLSVDTSMIPPDNIVEEKDAARALAKAKAEAAAAAEAERVRKANELAAREQEAASRSQTRTEAPPVPSSCNEYTGNKALGCALLLEAGFGLDQMGCLDLMWTHESHWNENAHNASSGAHGIPQALPGSKMAAFGPDWETNPVVQIRWGLDYIQKRYGSPCGAWDFWQAHNYY